MSSKLGWPFNGVESAELKLRPRRTLTADS